MPQCSARGLAAAQHDMRSGDSRPSACRARPFGWGLCATGTSVGIRTARRAVALLGCRYRPSVLCGAYPLRWCVCSVHQGRGQ